MNIVLETLIFAAIMLLIDIPWITFVMKKLYKNVFPIKIDYLSGAIAYILMILTYPFIISKSKDLKEKIKTSGFLGIIIFGTYGFTLAAIYGKYPITTALAETTWGAVLFILTTVISHFIIKKIDNK